MITLSTIKIILKDNFYRDIPIMGGHYTGTIKNCQMDCGKAINFCFGIVWPGRTSTFTGEIRNGCVWDGQGKNMLREGNKIGTFTGIYKFGQEYSGYIEPYNCLESVIYVKEGAFSNGISKLQSNNATYFQKLIEKKSKDNETKKKILMGYKNIFHSFGTEKKFDINNDTSRRFFETVFAKKLLNYTLNYTITSDPISQEKIKDRIKKLDQFTHFLLKLGEFIIQKSNYTEWKNSKNDSPPKHNSTLRQYAIKRKSLQSSLETIVESNYKKNKNNTWVINNDINQIYKNQKRMITNIYDLHYLQYSCDKVGIDERGFRSKIYEDDLGLDSSIYNKEPLYVKRGRLDNGYFAQKQSMHQGIFRSIDPTPYDLVNLKMDSSLANENNLTNDYNVRCPDRFEMDFPHQGYNKDKNSWLTSNFAKHVHPVVNGMSGSMLCQLRFLIYCKNFCDKYGSNKIFAKGTNEQIKSDMFKEFIAKNKLNIPTFSFFQVRDYLRIVTGLFVFYEGGHSLNEIMSPFDLPIVQKRLKKTFPHHSVMLNFENILFKDNSEALDSSIIETELYYTRQSQLRNNVHKDILNFNKENLMIVETRF